MMEQRSPEWHAERSGVINASEAGSLLGLNPYTSAKAARAKWIARRDGERDPDISHLPDVARGIELEPAILNRLEQELDVIIQQDGGRKLEDWLRASADGFDDIHVFEVKAPRKFADLTDRPDYALQMHIQMICYDRELGVFAQGVEMNGNLRIDVGTYTRDDLIAIHGITDPIMTLAELLDELQDAESAPEPPEAPEGFEDASTYYLMAKRAHDEAKAQLDEAKAALLAVTQNSPAVGERLMVIESTRQGSVNMKALAKANPGLDLDEYRGKPTTYLQIREVSR